MTEPKDNPPSIKILGIDQSIAVTLRNIMAFTTRAGIHCSPDVITAGDLVDGGAAVIIHTDNLVAEAGYFQWIRSLMGDHTPFTLITSAVASDEVKAICKDLIITRSVVYPNPDALDYLAEAMYLIATHKFKNTRTGDIV